MVQAGIYIRLVYEAAKVSKECMHSAYFQFSDSIFSLPVDIESNYVCSFWQQDVDSLARVSRTNFPL